MSVYLFHSVPTMINHIKLYNHLSNAGVADRLGITKQSVGFWARGTRNPSLYAIREICKTFDCRYLFYNEEIEDILGCQDYKFTYYEMNYLIEEGIKRANLSVKNLAGLIDTDKRTIEKWIRGSREPSMVKLYALCKILHCMYLVG